MGGIAGVGIALASIVAAVMCSGRTMVWSGQSRVLAEEEGRRGAGRMGFAGVGLPCSLVMCLV